MKTLYTTENKQAEKWVEAYWKSHDTELCHIYKRYSHEKEKAMYQCRCKMYEENGHNLRIISHNTNIFVVGWKTPSNDYRIETPNNSYLIIDLPF